MTSLRVYKGGNTQIGLRHAALSYLTSPLTTQPLHTPSPRRHSKWQLKQARMRTVQLQWCGKALPLSGNRLFYTTAIFLLLLDDDAQDVRVWRVRGTGVVSCHLGDLFGATLLRCEGAYGTNAADAPPRPTWLACLTDRCHGPKFTSIRYVVGRFGSDLLRNTQLALQAADIPPQAEEGGNDYEHESSCYANFGAIG